MTRPITVALASALLWAASVATQETSAQAPTTPASQGVFTTAQARRGTGVFEDVCLACHTLGRFRGENFTAKWSDKPLAVLFKAVMTMPQGEPGSLDPQDYADIIAYLLSVNDYPGGPQELAATPEAMAAIWLDARAP